MSLKYDPKKSRVLTPQTNYGWDQNMSHRKEGVKKANSGFL